MCGHINIMRNYAVKFCMKITVISIGIHAIGSFKGEEDPHRDFTHCADQPKAVIHLYTMENCSFLPAKLHKNCTNGTIPLIEYNRIREQFKQKNNLKILQEKSVKALNVKSIVKYKNNILV